MLQQRLILFHGQVQGVGFRYVTCRVAGGFDLTGFVRNCPDGTVECLAEGEHKEIDAFLAELESQMGHYIRRQTQQTAPHTGHYGRFAVRY